MPVPRTKKGSRKRKPSIRPFRHLILLLDYREPGHALVDLKPATLQPLAWKLLMCLAEVPGSVVPYAELYEVLWGETVVETNQLSFQKNAILSAITAASPSRREIIQTFPKLGFMLDLSPREVLIVPGLVGSYTLPSGRFTR